MAPRGGDRTESGAGAAVVTSPEAKGLQAWHLFLAVGLAGAAVAVALSQDRRPASLLLVSLTALAVVAVGVAVHRTLLPFAGGSGERPEAARLSARVRAALEREKLLVLRSIKELEFDRAMGKIADPDFTEMVGRLRTRAIALMQQLDAAAVGYRELVERDLAARLSIAGSAPPEEPAVASASVGTRHQPELARDCADCGTANDPDARFCKHCGARLDETARS